MNEEKRDKGQEILEYLHTHEQVRDELASRWRRNSLYELIFIFLTIFTSVMNLYISWAVFLIVWVLLAIRGHALHNDLMLIQGKITGALDILEILEIIDRQSRGKNKKKKESLLEKMWVAIKRKKQKEAYVQSSTK